MILTFVIFFNIYFIELKKKSIKVKVILYQSMYTYSEKKYNEINIYDISST